MRVELLTVEGCPNLEETRRRISAAIHDEDCSADVVQVQISSFEEASAMRFLGSPSVRIDGEDIEPSAKSRLEFGFMCRTYANVKLADGAPPVAMIRASIRRHADHRR